MEALWPGLDARAAAANLRKALHFARQALEPEHLRLRDEMVALEAPRLWIDVEAFQAAADAGELNSAIALYEGDLLPEDRFEPWTEVRREHLKSSFARLLWEWAHKLETSGEARAAAGVLERLVALDPLNEEAITDLMRSHALAGQRHMALRWYQQLEMRLGEELGVEPGPAARRLQEEIAAGRLEPARPPPAAIVLKQPPAEERKLVTAVLLDAVVPAGSGDPERRRLELDGCTTLVAEVLESWGGVSEQLVSGTVLAVFGVPRVHEDDAFRALRAALEVLERAPLPVRMGIGSGEVIAPANPEPRPREVAGEAIETAARLREAAEPGTVLALERTCRAAHERFRFGELIRLEQAGGEALSARRLLGLASAPAADDAWLDGPIVGRDLELGVMLNLFEEVVRSRQPRLLVVFGQPGVGKSRLVRAAVETILARRPETTVLRGRCLSAGRDVTYWALGEILRQACGISLTDPPGAAQTKLWEYLRVALGGLQPGGELDATAFALAATAGIALSDSPLERLEPKAVADELGRAWPRFASACASANPVLFVLEDLHWAGEQMLEMVELLAARSTGPLLVIATARPELAEAHPGFGPPVESLAAISLRPLTDQHCRELLRWLAPDRSSWAASDETILARVEGNPFFLEEIVLHLTQGGRGLLPDTLHSLLSARIDSRSGSEKRVLQQAAVVGRVFWEKPVERALGAEPATEHLLSLERAGFVVRRPSSSLPGQAEFMFRHALIHDVAYASIPRMQRGQAHAEVGDWLEEVVGSRAEEFAELLAYHFAAAALAAEAPEPAWTDPFSQERLRSKAFERLLQAGAGARRRFAVATAEQLDGQALALAADAHERLRALEALGDDRASVYRGEEAAEAYQGGLELARGARRGAHDAARLCWKLADLMAGSPGAFRVNPDPALAEQLIAEGIAATDDQVSRARLLVVRGAAARLYRGSEPFGQGASPDPLPIEDRIGAVREALATAKARGLPAVEEAANSALGLLYGIAGRYEEMIELHERELDALQLVPSRLDQADVLRRVAVNRINISGRFEEGLELARRCYELSTDTNPHQLMHATWTLAAALYRLGRWDELLPVVDEHLAAFREDPAVECQFVRDGPLIGATVWAYRGDRERAGELARMVPDPLLEPASASAWQALFAIAHGDAQSARAISVVKAREGRTYGPQHALALLEALVALEDWAGVADFLPTARANVIGNALLDPACDRAEGLLNARGEGGDGAIQMLRRALDRFEEMAVPFEAARTREHLAILQSGQPARRLFMEAMGAYERLGARPWQEAVQRRLSAG
jgi:DNA-binding SARP family transcriptional activator